MIKPLRGFVLIEPEKAEEKTASGVYLPENSQDKPAKGKIIARGSFEDKNDGIIPYPDAVEGDIVYFKKWAGTEVKEDGKEYVFVKFEDLLAVIEN